MGELVQTQKELIEQQKAFIALQQQVIEMQKQLNYQIKMELKGNQQKPQLLHRVSIQPIQANEASNHKNNLLEHLYDLSDNHFKLTDYRVIQFEVLKESEKGLELLLLVEERARESGD